MITKQNCLNKLGLLTGLFLASTTFAKQNDLKADYLHMQVSELAQGVTLLSTQEEDDGQTISDFESARQACSDFVGGTIAEAPVLKEIIKELGARLQPVYYWSSTIGTDCGAQECRIQIEAPTLNERSENAKNPTGGLICTTQHEEK